MPKALFTPSVKYARAHYCASLAIGQPTQAQHNANAAEFDRMLAAVIRDAKAEALREARVHIEWGDSALHDDEWEYTCSSDCDGSNVMYQRRHPRHRGEYHPWEPATRLAYDAAVRASSPSESEA